MPWRSAAAMTEDYQAVVWRRQEAPAAWVENRAARAALGEVYGVAFSAVIEPTAIARIVM
jgi:hypothetical protein